MRAPACFVFLLLLVSVAFPIVHLQEKFTAGSDQAVYTKGKTITISGSGASGQVETLITSGTREIYRNSIQASGSFSDSYKIRALDPKGQWIISVSSGEQKKEMQVSVSPTREGAFYLVRFTSPASGGAQYRTDSIPVSITVLDAGKPVSGANIRAFVGAKEFSLAGTSPGNYQGDYEIPFDFPIGSTEVYAVVEKTEGGSSFGGESSVAIEVKGSPMQIEFLSPSIGSYKLGDTIPVQVRVSYSTGKPVESPSITAKANDFELALSSDGDSYSGQYKVRENDTGVLSFSVFATDSAGNAGSAYRNVEIKGIAAQAVTDYYWYLVLGAIVLVAVVAFAAKAFLDRSSVEKLEKEKDDLLTMEKGLQEDYIKKGTIDRETFQKKMAIYEVKLSEVEDKLKKKNAKAKKK